MPYLRHKTIKGKTYRYLVEGYRERDKVRQRTLQYLGAVPKLPRNAKSAVVLFAGGGGVEVGMVQAGIRPRVSVERDPTNPSLSDALALQHHLNFKPFGTKVIHETVEELAARDFPGVPRGVDFLHASPPCSNFSIARKGEEQESDKVGAIASAQAISTLAPRVFTLENVPSYRESEAWYLIEQTLKAEGYQVVSTILDAADYGVPQSRKRFVAKASRDGIPALPAKQRPIGWYEALSDIIPSLPSSQLLPAQEKALEQKLSQKPGLEALLIERTGFRNLPQVREPAEPCWTIRKSIFHDDRGSNRNRFVDIWMLRNEVRGLTVDAIAILQGFPKWYYLPPKAAVAGSILGYSVPPPLVTALLGRSED
jgi:DNA (cytosine-5)-methyltransferase 1